MILAIFMCLVADWPGWRGPGGTAVVTDPGVPVQWSATENVAWKVPVPGVGHSSPVVAGGKVFLTAFDPATGERSLIAFDQQSGRQLWKSVVLSAPAERMHRNNTPASATPATDGEHVWTAFAEGDALALACHTAGGEPVWLKRFAGFASPHGFCGTPVLHNNRVILNGDSDGAAFLAALDKLTGETVWKIDRPNNVRSFSVPIFIAVNGRTQMVVAGSKSVAAYDPATGGQIWVVRSPTVKFVATAAFADGIVFATGTSPERTLAGIDPTGAGDVTASRVVWRDSRGAAYVPSPIGFKDRFFVLSDDGTASLRVAKTGKVLWSERLGGRLYHASPLLINGRIYCLATDGTTQVLSSGDEFEKLATNKLGEECHATPAVAAGRLYVRSAGHLWCLTGQ